MAREHDSARDRSTVSNARIGGSAEVAYVAVTDLRADGDPETCLRPLGLCELGGSCDSCWYRPDHPRFRRNGRATAADRESDS